MNKIKCILIDEQRMEFLVSERETFRLGEEVVFEVGSREFRGSIQSLNTLFLSDLIDSQPAHAERIARDVSNLYPELNKKAPVTLIYLDGNDSAKELKDGNNATSVSRVKLFTDGGSRGNPGPSATGFAILSLDDKVLKAGGTYLGITTNNQAEYKAVLEGLDSAYGMGAVQVDVYMDSLLVVNQMSGIFKIKNADLLKINVSIHEAIKKFDKVSFKHVPRALNKLADAEVNRVLDSQ